MTFNLIPRKEVCCLNHNQWFSSYEEAAEHYGITRISSISKVATSTKLKPLGVDKDLNIRLFWSSYSLYKQKMKAFEQSRNPDVLANKRVVCLNTNELFDSVGIAKAEYGISNPVHIINSCLSSTSAGRAEDGQKLFWAFLDDFDPGQKEFIKNDSRANYFQEVICVETKEVFTNCYVAAHFVKGSPRLLHKACTDSNFAHGKDPNGKFKKELHWAFHKDCQEKEFISSLPRKSYSKKVICLNTLEIFDSIHEATTYAGRTGAGVINKSCNSVSSTSGRHPITGERLHWAHLDDYIFGKKTSFPKPKDKTISKPKKDPNQSIKNRKPLVKVVCLNTNETFESANAAASFAGVTVTFIRASYRSERFSAGRHPVTSEKLYWATEEEYLSGTKTMYPGNGLPLKPILNSNSGPKRVVCLNTKEVFPTISSAARKYNVQIIAITNSYRNDRISAGIDPITKEWLYWALEEDFLSGTKVNYPGNGLAPSRNSMKRKVYCVTTDLLFNSVNAAKNFYYLSNPSSIISSCNYGNSYGEDPISNEPLYWVFYED